MKTKTITFPGETKMRLKDGRVEVFLSGALLKGSPLLTVKADGEAGRELSQLIREELLREIPGAILLPDGSVEYYDEDGLPRFAVARAAFDPLAPRLRVREQTVVTWHQRIDAATIFDLHVAPRLITAAMSWPDLREEGTLQTNGVTVEESKQLAVVLSLAPFGGGWMTSQGFQLYPSSWNEQLVLLGKTGNLAPQEIERIQHVRKEVFTPHQPVLLDLSRLNRKEVNEVITALRHGSDDPSGLRLINTDDTSTVYWNGSYPTDLVSAGVDLTGGGFRLSGLKRESISGFFASKPLTGEAERDDFIGACALLLRLIGAEREVTVDGSCDQPAPQLIQVPARSLMPGDVLGGNERGVRRVITSVEVALLRSGEVGVKVTARLPEDPEDSFDTSYAFAPEEQIRLSSRASA